MGVPRIGAGATEGGKQPGNGRRNRVCLVRPQLVRESVMGVVDVDPFAVLPHHCRLSECRIRPSLERQP